MALNSGWTARICGTCMVVAAVAGCGRGVAQLEQPPELFSEAAPYEIEDFRPAPSSPNVIVWVVDDLGFGQVGAFGGVIETPTLDALAASGLIYTNYHTTPICSASRAALLTGRNSHNVGGRWAFCDVDRLSRL